MGLAAGSLWAVSAQAFQPNCEYEYNGCVTGIEADDAECTDQACLDGRQKEELRCEMQRKQCESREEMGLTTNELLKEPTISH